jgi:hypothetical protein
MRLADEGNKRYQIYKTHLVYLRDATSLLGPVGPTLTSALLYFVVAAESDDSS